jgi:hypothetical protein
MKKIDIKTNYTREELIAICEKAIVPEKHWLDRDSYSSQKQVGECWALLKAGCKFKILTEGNLITDDQTIWVETEADGFEAFEYGGTEYRERETHYLPTEKRLKRKGDWY